MPRFLLIGLDGLEPSLAERWMDEGRLPALGRLRDTGSYMPCASVAPPVTYPAWSTCVTGVNPGRHGIFDFTEMVPGAYAIRFVNSTDRRAPALWDVLSDAGKRVGVLGVPGTYPPSPVNGFMVSGFDSPVATSIDRSFVYPQELYESVKEWRFADFQEADIGDGWHDMALSRLLAKIEVKERIACELLAREPWDFFMAVFGESDTVSHHFWLHHDPVSPRHRPGHETAIRQVYERLDRTVGGLIEAAGEDVTVAVCSDHGFGGAGTGVVHLNNWLEEHGYLQFTHAADSLLKRLALAVTPARMRGPLFRRFRTLATRAESQSRFAGIDWSQTTAFSEELNYFPSIRVNLREREPNGRVTQEDYTSFCRDLCAKLESWDPVKKAWLRDELYHGPHVGRAPDIIVELALEDGYSHSCLRSRGGPSFRRIEAHEHLGGKERGMNGNHRPAGVLFLSKRTVCGSASLEDIAPAVLAELGVAAPPMDGTSLLDPPRPGESISVPSASVVYSPAEEAKVEQRLRELGYFE